MSVEPRQGLIGLVTNASTLATPAGALIEAENVVIRRPGTAEPRDGLAPGTGMNGTEAWGFSYGTRNLIARWTGTAYDWRTTAGETLTGYAQPLRRDVLTRVESRGVLYLPSDTGVHRLSGAATAFADAGLVLFSFVTNAIAGSTTAPFWLPTGYHVGYRIVGYNKTADGMIRRSIPSGMFELANSSGADRNGILTVKTPAGAAYTEFEVYRSIAVPVGIQLDDEMRLVGRFPTNNFSADETILTDNILPEALGATLYTSPSRDGITGQNDRPPACACVAAYKGSVFFGNIRGPQQALLDYKWDGALTTDKGIGVRTYAGTMVAGNVLISMPGGTAGIQIGMLVSYASGVDVSSVTAVAANSVNLSPALPGVTSATTFVFSDVLEINGTKMILPRLTGASGTVNFNLLSMAPAAGLQAYLVTPPTGGYNSSLVVQSISRSATPALTIRATHGAEYSPPLPEMSATAQALTQDVSPGMLMWSKTDEPEHVAPVNYAFVGDKLKAILGLVPTRDALFILKEDGVWRLTGANTLWRIDPYDVTLFCCLPTSVVALQEQAYFLSNKGVIAFSDAGSEIVSLPVNDQIKPVIDQIFSGFRSTGLYEVTSVVGSVAGVYERENEYTLLTARGSSPFVYNRNTGAWCTWAITAGAGEPGLVQAVFHLSYMGRVVYALTTGAGVTASFWTWLSTDAALSSLAQPPHFNNQTAITVLSVAAGPSATTRTLTLSAPVVALQDDAIHDNRNRLWRVTASTGVTTTITVEALGTATVSTGVGVFYRTLRCKVTPQVFSAPPPRPKHWRGFSTAFSSLTGPIVVRYAYASSESPRQPDFWDQEDVDWPRAAVDSNMAQLPMGFSYLGLVPNAHARAWSLRASVRWVMSHGAVFLEGFYVDSETMAIGRQQKG